jgi:hypothetical protein
MSLLRSALGGNKVNKVRKVCLRYLRCVLGKNEVAEVCLRWLRYARGGSKVPEVVT